MGNIHCTAEGVAATGSAVPLEAGASILPAIPSSVQQDPAWHYPHLTHCALPMPVWGYGAGQRSGAVGIPHPAQHSTQCQYIEMISCSSLQLSIEPSKPQTFQSCEHREGTETGISQMQRVSISNLHSARRSQVLGAAPCNIACEELFRCLQWVPKYPTCSKRHSALHGHCCAVWHSVPAALEPHHCPGTLWTSNAGCQMSRGDPWGTLLQEAI